MPFSTAFHQSELPLVMKISRGPEPDGAKPRRHPEPDGLRGAVRRAVPATGAGEDRDQEADSPGTGGF